MATSLDGQTFATLLEGERDGYTRLSFASPSPSKHKRFLSKKSREILRDSIAMVPETFRKVDGSNEYGVPTTLKIDLEKSKGDTAGIFLRQGDGFERPTGIFVSRLEMGSRAETLGLRIGDEVVEVNGVDVTGGNIEWVEMLMKVVNVVVLTARKSSLTTPAVSWSPASLHQKALGNTAAGGAKVSSLAEEAVTPRNHPPNLPATVETEADGDGSPELNLDGLIKAAGWPKDALSSETSKPLSAHFFPNTPSRNLLQGQRDHESVRTEHVQESPPGAAIKEHQGGIGEQSERFFNHRTDLDGTASVTSFLSEPDNATVQETMANTIANSSPFALRHAVAMTVPGRRLSGSGRSSGAAIGGLVEGDDRRVQFNLPPSSGREQQSERLVPTRLQFDHPSSSVSSSSNGSQRPQMTSVDDAADSLGADLKSASILVDSVPRIANKNFNFSESDLNVRAKVSSNDSIAMLLERARVLRSDARTRSVGDRRGNETHSMPNVANKVVRSSAVLPRYHGAVEPLEERTIELAQGRGSTSGRVHQVVLNKVPSGLGMTIIGGANTALGALFIDSVKPGGEADRNGGISHGDRILSVEGVSTLGMGQPELLSFLSTLTHGKVVFELMHIGADAWEQLRQTVEPPREARPKLSVESSLEEASRPKLSVESSLEEASRPRPGADGAELPKRLQPLLQSSQPQLKETTESFRAAVLHPSFEASLEDAPKPVHEADGGKLPKRSSLSSSPSHSPPPSPPPPPPASSPPSPPASSPSRQPYSGGRLGLLIHGNEKASRPDQTTHMAISAATKSLRMNFLASSSPPASRRKLYLPPYAPLQPRNFVRHTHGIEKKKSNAHIHSPSQLFGHFVQFQSLFLNINM